MVRTGLDLFVDWNNLDSWISSDSITVNLRESCQSCPILINSKLLYFYLPLSKPAVGLAIIHLSDKKSYNQNF